MTSLSPRCLWLTTITAAIVSPAIAGQAPGQLSDPNVSISHRDRVYTADQFSNTVSVTDPADNLLVGTIRLGDSQPGNFSPLYRGQVLVHGLGFSPDHKTLAIVSIGSNSVSFVDTQTSAVKHVTYVGRSPHEAFFTPEGSELWVTVRGEDYISVIDTTTFAEKLRIAVPNGPGMQIFSPDGTYGYICSSFTPETVVVTVKDHKIVGHVKQASPFCPNIAATPDGRQVWFTLKDIGKVQIFDAHPPFTLIKTIDTGPITNHVNFAQTPKGLFAYVTVGALNQVKVFRTDSFEQVANIAVGKLPHGIWPSGDGTRVYVGLENDDRMVAIDTAANKVISTSPLGQAPQALVYVSNAVPIGDGKLGLEPLGQAAGVTRLSLIFPKGLGAAANDQISPTSVSLFDQGLTQILEASVSGLRPGESYVLAFAGRPDGSGALQALSAFRTNPAGSAIVNAAGPIRQIIKQDEFAPQRYLVILSGTPAQMGEVVQIQQLRRGTDLAPIRRSRGQRLVASHRD